MRATAKTSVPASANEDRKSKGDFDHRRLPDLLKRYFEGQNHLRKGICLLNAGAHKEAVRELSKASRLNPESKSLPAYLVAALVGDRNLSEAATVAAQHMNHHPQDVDSIIRLALIRFQSGNHSEAIRTLRNGIRTCTDSAELQFQLGTMLATIDENEEAELRFTQALAIEKDHTDSLVALAMCCGAQNDMRGAFRYLEKAQKLKPFDAGILLMLTHAAKANAETGDSCHIWAEMPPTEPQCNNPNDLDVLSQAIERDPEFAEAFLEIDDDGMDDSVYQILVTMLIQAVERSPQRARLHYLHGAALARLNRCDEAITAIENAVQIDPRYLKAMILLAKLYECTDRPLDATSRLEQAILLGAEYADTYFLLGNLYCDSGQVERARWAYRQALRINGQYQAAQQALDTLAA